MAEDCRVDAEIIRDELRCNGFEPKIERVETETGMRAALTCKPWDIIIADYNLPSFDALQAIELLKDSGLDIPLIVVSGTVGEDIAVKAMQAGARDYVMKDCLVRLIPAIKRELADHKLRQQEAQNKQELSTLQQAKDLIISTLAHDLKSPIATSINLLEQLKIGSFGHTEPEQVELIQELIQTRRYEGHLVDNILSVFSDQILNFQSRFERIDLNQLLREQIVPIFQYIAESKGITLELQLAESLPEVYINPFDIKRVLNNLLYNAFQYTSSKGTITIESQFASSEITLVVRDTGIGIEDQYLKALFYQCEPTNRRFHSGAGIGLYLSKKIMDIHHGRIWVKTELGKGSQFFLALPHVLQEANNKDLAFLQG
jgi:two-component system sensor histidine kinase EvgS